MVFLTDIGAGYNALHCLTNLTTCCRVPRRMGQWILPNGFVSFGGGTDFYTRRGPSAVLLNRRTDAEGPTGLFTCQVPDESGTNRTLYIGVDLSMQHALKQEAPDAWSSYLQVLLSSLTSFTIALPAWPV